MANMTVAAGGQINGAGDSKALFLKVFSGEILAAFNAKNVMAARTQTRTISSGKSAQFPATWKVNAKYHTPGTELTGQTVNNAERVISIDDLLVADLFIPSIEEAMSHYDYRSEYTRQLGIALATAYDKHLIQVGILAARAAATVTGGDGGTQLTNGTALTDADSFVASLADAAAAMDEKNVPEDERYALVTPALWYKLVNSSSKLIDRDYNVGGGANGNIRDGKVIGAHGFQFVKTNNLPNGLNITTDPAAYNGDFTNTASLCFQRGAVGTVKLIDLAVEMEYLIKNQGTFTVAKLAVGHGILRPECAVEIKTV